MLWRFVEDTKAVVVQGREVISSCFFNVGSYSSDAG